MVQGKLVNGSLGQVVEFRSVRQALQEGYEIAKVDTTQPGEPQIKAPPEPELLVASEEMKNPAVWPVVHFTNGRTLLCIPVDFSSENARGDVEASRYQVGRILRSTRPVMMD